MAGSEIRDWVALGIAAYAAIAHWPPWWRRRRMLRSGNLHGGSTARRGVTSPASRTPPGNVTRTLESGDLVSDSQYDLTLALLSDSELDQWERIQSAALVRAQHGGESVEGLARNIAVIAIERERRRLDDSAS